MAVSGRFAGSEWPIPEMRPIFHFTERRIEAHVCICFVAYKVYKELERVIRHVGIAMSVDKVLDIAKTIITIDVKSKMLFPC